MNIQKGFLQVRELIANNLMCELNREELREKFGHGGIFVACSDCDRFHGYFSDLSGPLNCRMHTHALNGGAILLDPELSGIIKDVSVGEAVRGAGQSILGITGIEGARALKKNLDLIALLSHFPCGMASVLKMEFFDIVMSTLNAKKLLKKQFGEDEKVLALISIDWRNSDQETEQAFGIKTYAISLKNMEAIQNIIQ